MDYFDSKKLAGSTMKSIRHKVEEVLEKEGFGVLTEIDIQATMKKKLNKDYLPHLILGACNPVFADKVLSVDQHISLLLPCNLSIRDLGNEMIEVAVIKPLEAMKSIGNPNVKVYAKEVSEKLNRVLENI